MTLKRSGPHLEHLYKDQLDKLGIALRNACRDDELDLVSDVMGCDVMGWEVLNSLFQVSRVHILEIIELRAMNWQPNENVTAFYKQKLSQLEYSGHLDQIPPSTPCTPGLDSPGVGTAFYSSESSIKWSSQHTLQDKSRIVDHKLHLLRAH